MTGGRLSREGDPPADLDACHICPDIRRRLPSGPRRRALRRGSLDPLGPITRSVGGCGGNRGIALQRLGMRSTLVARVGDDRLGGVLSELVREAVPGDAAQLIIAAGEPTSYSLISNLPGRGRAIQHFSGVNDTFAGDDVPDELLGAATLLHVGYPPLMAAVGGEDGGGPGGRLGRGRGPGL